MGGRDHSIECERHPGVWYSGFNGPAECPLCTPPDPEGEGSERYETTVHVRGNALTKAQTTAEARWRDCAYLLLCNSWLGDEILSDEFDSTALHERGLLSTAQDITGEYETHLTAAGIEFIRETTEASHE